jgi:23S rRNA (guanosine2251-2'-O)-methyltransferase
MIRCAEGAGAHGVIVPKRHAAGLTAVVAKSSAGALNHMYVVKVSNLHTTVLELQKRGVWIYVAEADGTNYSETDLTGPAAFLFGSEGNGVSPLLRATADFTVSLPMRGKVNSLNVSAATAIILYESARQRDVKKNAKI